MENVLNSNCDTMSISDHNENVVLRVVNTQVCYIYLQVEQLKQRNQTVLVLGFMYFVCSGNQSRSERR